MIVGVFVPAIRTFEFSFRENGLSRQIIALRTLVCNHRVGEFRIAIVAFEDPFGHKDPPYPPRNLLKIQKNIYLPLVLSERYRAKTASENRLENRFSRAVYFRKFLRPRVRRRWLMDQTNYLWQAAYMAAVYETDDSLMQGRIFEALAALEQRLLSPIEAHSEEYRAIKNAQAALETLKAERLHNPTDRVSA